MTVGTKKQAFRKLEYVFCDLVQRFVNRLIPQLNICQQSSPVTVCKDDDWPGVRMKVEPGSNEQSIIQGEQRVKRALRGNVSPSKIVLQDIENSARPKRIYSDREELS